MGHQNNKKVNILLKKEISAKWSLIRLKYLTKLKYGDSLKTEDRNDGDINVYGSNGIIGTNNYANTLEPVIIIGRKGSSGKINYSEKKCYSIDTTYYIDKSQTKLNLKWLYYLLGALKLDDINKDSAVPGLSRDEVYNIYVLNATPTEQNTIADFLDRLTTQIDKLISQKEKLIELLKEKRIALITKVVTKGLDSKQKMKSTGYKWLKEMPSHWISSKVGFCFDIKLGKMLQSDPQNEKDILKPYLRAANIQWREINRESIYEMYFDEKEVDELKLKKGDLLISEGGDIGRSCLWDSDEEMYYQNAIVRVREPNKFKVKIEFLYYWLYFLKMKGIINLYCNTATISHYTAEKVNSTKLIYPDIEEQTKIINYINSNVKFIDSIISKTEITIEKLKEYRSALITSAVTGQIDVRDYKIPEEIEV